MRCKRIVLPALRGNLRPNCQQHCQQQHLQGYIHVDMLEARFIVPCIFLLSCMCIKLCSNLVSASGHVTTHIAIAPSARRRLWDTTSSCPQTTSCSEPCPKMAFGGDMFEHVMKRPLHPFPIVSFQGDVWFSLEVCFCFSHVVFLNHVMIFFLFNNLNMNLVCNSSGSDGSMVIPLQIWKSKKGLRLWFSKSWLKNFSCMSSWLMFTFRFLIRVA